MKRLSFLTIALIASLAFTPLAQDCNNPLLGFFGLPALNSPQSGSNLPFCADLQSAQTCCSPNTVASFQDRIDGLITNLNTYFAGRDLYIAQLRDRYFTNFNNMLQDININHQDGLQALRLLNSSIADQLQGIILNATKAFNATQPINGQFAGNLTAYQQARSTCFTTALEVQGSAWCLACDPNYASKGVAQNDVVTFDNALCQAISNACSPYFNQSANLNPLFVARQAYWSLVSVRNYLTSFITNGILNNFTVPPDPYNPLPSQLPTTPPAQWQSSGNAADPAQCQTFWAGDGQLASLLNIGAATAPNGTSTGTWGPDLTGTGLNVGALRQDPGDYFGAV